MKKSEGTFDEIQDFVDIASKFFTHFQIIRNKKK